MREPVKALTEEDLIAHKLLVRIDRLEDQLRRVIDAMREGTDYDDPMAQYLASVH